ADDLVDEAVVGAAAHEVLEAEADGAAAELEGLEVVLHRVAEAAPARVAPLVSLLGLPEPGPHPLVVGAEEILPRQGDEAEGVFHVLDIVLRQAALEGEAAHAPDLGHGGVARADRGFAVLDKVVEHPLDRVRYEN